MSYGLLIKNADGSVALDSLSRPPRLIFHEQFAWDFSGTRSVPGFDSARGFISIAMGYHKADAYPSNANVDPSTPLGSQAHVYLDLTSLPSVDFDDVTKVLTLSPASFTDTYVTGQSAYAVFMVMYR